MPISEVFKGDAEIILSQYADNAFDSFVSDPPYGLKFMGKHWDYDVPAVSVFKEMFRTLKSGGYILIACGTRTQHRMAVNIEDAGFEIRDVISWLYGSGFPKSLDISKAIDKKFGAEREVVGYNNYTNQDIRGGGYESDKAKIKNRLLSEITEASTDEAKQWEGWGTALKPAQEFWTLARKPISEKTVAENVLKHGTGGINIDGCRIEHDEEQKFTNRGQRSAGWNMDNCGFDSTNNNTASASPLGRFPSNVILDEFMGKELDKMTGNLNSGTYNKSPLRVTNNWMPEQKEVIIKTDFNDEGGASRFFYCAKADGFERNKGLKDFDKGEPPASARSKAAEGRENALGKPRANHHPTVKPIELMRYLVKLITPKGGLTCDPYCGSGTTLIAAKLELINAIGIEREQEYVDIAEARIAAWNPEKYKEQTLF